MIENIVFQAVVIIDLVLVGVVLTLHIVDWNKIKNSDDKRK